MKKPDILLIRELTPLDYSNPIFSHPVTRELEDNGFFSNKHFTFVGVYYSVDTDTTVIGYPKYMPEYIKNTDGAKIISHVNLVCKVIEQARPYLDKSLVDNAYDFDAHDPHSQKQYVNRYNLAVSILQDYIMYGIYYSKIKRAKRNGNGTVIWHRTIYTVSPVIDRDVIYLDTINKENHQDYSQLATHLHIWIVTRCAHLLQGIGQYNELELPEITQWFDDSSLNQYVPYLLGKLSTVFSDREIRLMKSLAAWCGQSVFYRNQMGVTSFDRIWEYATKQVFGNINDTRSGPPSYFIGDKEYSARGNAIPDILRVFRYKNNTDGVIGILDAKYYSPQINERRYEIYGAPPNSDIEKQIGYYRYLRQQYPQSTFKFTNAFLFPDLFQDKGRLFEKIGFARPNSQRHSEMDSLLGAITVEKKIEHDFVLLYTVDADSLFTACLNGVKVDNNTFYENFITPFYDIPN